MKTLTRKIPLWVTLIALTCTSSDVILAAEKRKSSKKPKEVETKLELVKTNTLTKAMEIAPDVPYTQEIEMFAGETRTIPEPNVGRLAVGNGEFLSASVLDNKEILLIANQPGTTSLHVWTRKGATRRIKVNVMPSETDRVTREIKSFLSTIPNTKVSVIGANVVVEGDQLTDVDLAKIDALVKRYPQIINFSNRIGWEKMIVMEVKICEFPTNELRDLGVKWNGMGGGGIGGVWSPVSRGGLDLQLNTTSTGGTNRLPVSFQGTPNVGPLTSATQLLTALNFGLNGQLNMLVQNGRASILAEPVLSARNGAKATFLVGGEIPYVARGENGSMQVMFKEYGIKMNIEPKIDATGVIRANILSEVSAVDTSLTTNAGPGLSTRKTTTEFNVREGETIVLSGLLSRDVNTNVDKVPLLGDLPVLGGLFRSKRYQNKETELVVFVTPHLMDSATPELAKRVERAEERLRETPRAEPPEPKTKKIDPKNRPAWGEAIP